MTRQVAARGTGTRRPAVLAAAFLLPLLTLLGAGPAAADDVTGSLLQAPATATGAEFTVQVQRGSQPVDLTNWKFHATAEPNGAGRAVPIPVEPHAGTKVHVSVILALDISGSIQPAEFAQMKSAAIDAVRRLPAGIPVGVWSITTQARRVIGLTQSHPGVMDAIRGLQRNPDPKGKTALNAGAIDAIGDLQASGGAGKLLLFTDGHNEVTPPTDAQARAVIARASADPNNRVTTAGIYLKGPQNWLPQLQELVGPDQRVFTASDSTQLDRLFAQITDFTKTVVLDADVRGIPALSGKRTVSNVTLTGSSPDGATSFTIGPFATALGIAPAGSPRPTARAVVPVRSGDSRFAAVTSPVLYGALALLFVALCVMVAAATGALTAGADSQARVLRRLSVYTISGRQPHQIAVREQTTRLGDSAFTRGAVGLMGRVTHNRGFENGLDRRLEAAGLPLRTAEWMIVHICAAVLGGVLFWLVSHGMLFGLLLGLLLGALGPWFFLSVRRARRESRFLAQLPDTLQLLAGSLQAGYSLPQAMDSVVREAHPPISQEFNRALVETRLGMPAEDALDGIGIRTDSRDFSWIVMAIRIQREVGGNLAELLTTVAETLRERERLRRQVRALSAEGRLSGLILGALPLVFAVYLFLAQPTYIGTLVTDPIGVLLLIVGGALLVVGAFWMSRVVKVKV